MTEDELADTFAMTDRYNEWLQSVSDLNAYRYFVLQALHYQRAALYKLEKLTMHPDEEVSRQSKRVAETINDIALAANMLVS